ncbi:MAG: ATP-binding cassette domain-containing protein [Chryseotalea sp. WA131a]|nr:MAG: ATP-binding cassette domain-containing protein [Chryseotalea sp. WA131a]
MPIVSFRNTSLQYGNQLTIRVCYIEVTENKTTAIVGKSGSGKSNLLQPIIGLERPTPGEVQVFGQRLNYQAIQTVRLRCDFMVQGSGLFPAACGHLSCFVLNPTLSLMDEPFGALDSITHSEIHQEIVQLQKLQPRTNLLVTHDAGYFSLLTC